MYGFVNKFVVRKTGLEVGLIPAYAEKTGVLCCVSLVYQAHPRMGGENSRRQVAREARKHQGVYGIEA